VYIEGRLQSPCHLPAIFAALSAMSASCAAINCSSVMPDLSNRLAFFCVRSCRRQRGFKRTDAPSRRSDVCWQRPRRQRRGSRSRATERSVSCRQRRKAERGARAQARRSQSHRPRSVARRTFSAAAMCSGIIVFFESLSASSLASDASRTTNSVRPSAVSSCPTEPPAVRA